MIRSSIAVVVAVLGGGAAWAQDGHGPIDLGIDFFSSTRVRGHFTAPPNSDGGWYGYLGFEVRAWKDNPLTADTWDAGQTVIAYKDDGTEAGGGAGFDSGASMIPVFESSDSYYIAVRYKYWDAMGDEQWSDVFNCIANWDQVPPSTVMDLICSAAAETTLSLSWTAPADDGDLEGGPVAAYEMWTSTIGAGSGSVENWITLATTKVHPAPPIPAEAGDLQNTTLNGLDPATVYYVAIRALDENGNKGTLALFTVGPTLPPSTDDGEDGATGSGSSSQCSARASAGLAVAALLMVTLRLRL